MNICITNTFSLFLEVVPIAVCLILLLVVFSRSLKCRLFVCRLSPPQQSIHKADKYLKKKNLCIKAKFISLQNIIVYSVLLQDKQLFK